MQIGSLDPIKELLKFDPISSNCSNFVFQNGSNQCELFKVCRVFLGVVFIICRCGLFLFNVLSLLQIQFLIRCKLAVLDQISFGLVFVPNEVIRCMYHKVDCIQHQTITMLRTYWTKEKPSYQQYYTQQLSQIVTHACGSKLRLIRLTTKISW